MQGKVFATLRPVMWNSFKMNLVFPYNVNITQTPSGRQGGIKKIKECRKFD